VKLFSEKVYLIITKLAADNQQPNTRNAQHVGLGGNMEDDAAFSNFFGSA
jgi:hypothetical protein